MYVGMDSHTLRIEGKTAKEKKERDSDMGEKMGKENKKIIRKIEDELLLVVPARIYGKIVKALFDSGATRCLITPSCVTAVKLKGILHYSIFRYCS